MNHALQLRRIPGAFGVLHKVLEQGDQFVHRHQKADLVTGGRHIYPNHFAIAIDHRAATHARVDGAGKVDAVVKAATGNAVIGTRHQCHAQVHRVAHGNNGFAFLWGFLRQFEVLLSRFALLSQDRQVIDHIHIQQLQLAFFPVYRQVIDGVLLGIADRFRHHVVIGGDHAVGGNLEAGAEAGFGVRGALDQADLIQAAAIITVQLLVTLCAGKAGPTKSGPAEKGKCRHAEKVVQAREDF